MTPLEHSLITLLCMMVAYYVGNHLGKMTGIKSTLDYMESVGAIEIDKEDDQD